MSRRDSSITSLTRDLQKVSRPVSVNLTPSRVRISQVSARLAKVSPFHPQSHASISRQSHVMASPFRERGQMRLETETRREKPTELRKRFAPARRCNVADHPYINPVPARRLVTPDETRDAANLESSQQSHTHVLPDPRTTHMSCATQAGAPGVRSGGGGIRRVHRKQFGRAPGPRSRPRVSVQGGARVDCLGSISGTRAGERTFEKLSRELDCLI
jgi:hypothetical protein